MDHFALFEQYIQTRDQSINPLKKKEYDDSCKHSNILEENGIKVCTECGIEITRDITYDKEWRYYGASDTRHNTDPNRCHARKSDERTIYKDVGGLGFSDKIIAKANELYEEVTNKKIYRGNSRKAIVFACIFHAYKIEGNPQSCESLVDIFNLDRKIGLKGLKHVNLNAPKDSKVRTTYITPENLVEEIMDKFDASIEAKKEVIQLYSKIKNKSSILNRSRPQSVASGLVRYYCLLKNKEISMSNFKDKVKLSELTINRIAKEISRILQTPEIVS